MSHNLMDWIKRIPGSHLELGAVPLMGFPPAFPWNYLTNELSKVFGKEVSLQQGKVQIRQPSTFMEGIVNTPIIFNLSVPGFEGHLTWIMSRPNLRGIMGQLLSGEETFFLSTEDEDFFEAFCKFLVFQVSTSLTSGGYPLSFHRMHTSDLEEEDALSCDVEITVQGAKSFGRLIVWPRFQEAMRQHFKQCDQESKIEEDLEVPVHLEVGGVEMKPADWEQVKAGDFIVLDNCSLDGNQGTISMTVGGALFVRGRLENGTIKIT